MLRGNHTAKIDDKGRLKVPSQFRAYIEEQYGTRLFVTSLSGDYVRIYPLAVWEGIEARLASMPTTHPTRIKFLDTVNYYGQATELDGQGRVLIPPRLRETASINGEVDVLGVLSYLDVWNHERFATRIATNRLTDEDLAALAGAGI
ncbi:MAG: putative MraZ protein [Acidobacteria bacterium]|nr:putative MraZ protein [Acidobacteriota bacterium]